MNEYQKDDFGSLRSRDERNVYIGGLKMYDTRDLDRRVKNFQTEQPDYF